MQLLERVVDGPGPVGRRLLGAAEGEVAVRGPEGRGAPVGGVAEELGEPAGKQRPEGGHGAADDGEVDLDGRPDVGDVVVADALAEVEEAVDVDEADDGDDGDPGE